MAVANATMEKFGWPGSEIAAYDRWVVLLRPRQVTVGSLVLVNRSAATSFATLKPEDFADMRQAVADLETALQKAFAYDKINYLMLMMVDPHVHFHVLPRYAEARTVEGMAFRDADWPGAPNIGGALDMSPAHLAAVAAALKAAWPA